MKVGMMGVTFCSGNKGCEALGYSFLEALNQIGKRNGIKIEATLIEVFPTRLWLQNHCNMKKTVEKLIEDAAFMAVTLEETRQIIARDGVIEVYQNGENQKGIKKMIVDGKEIEGNLIPIEEGKKVYNITAIM